MEKTFLEKEEHADFIEDFENHWLQYASLSEKLKAFFGTEANAYDLYERWKNNEDIWCWKKEILWNLEKRNSKN